MCVPLILAGIAVVAAGVSIYETEKHVSYESAVARMNAKFADQAATTSSLAGTAQAEVTQAKAGQFEGSQKSQLAGSGVDVGSGSALDVLADTRIMSQEDVATVKSNAAQRAYGAEAAATGYNAAASQYSAQGSWDVAKTLIGAAGTAAGAGVKTYGEWKANGGSFFPAGGKE